jgi:hypothetical protein
MDGPSSLTLKTHGGPIARPVRLRSVLLAKLAIFAAGGIRFERGEVRYRPWREVGRRPYDWASHSLKGVPVQTVDATPSNVLIG